MRPFKGIIYDDISEFESYHLSQAVRSQWAMSAWQQSAALGDASSNRHVARPVATYCASEMQLRDSACALGDKSEREPDLSAVRPTSGRLYGISVPKPSGVPGGCNAANAAGGHHRDPGLSERGAPVSYQYSFEDLLALLHGRSPAKVDAVALNRRRVEHGHLSVGLKIHCLGDGRQFSTLVEGLGGAQKILDVNFYKHSHASLCLVLPPVGSARSAILLLESIEHFIDAVSGGDGGIARAACTQRSRRCSMGPDE